jgi:hypothetical protein
MTSAAPFRRIAAGKQRRRQSPDKVIAATESPPPRLRPGRKCVPSASPTLNRFGDDALPRGFRYQEDFLNSGEEHPLLQHIKPLPFRAFEFHGFTGKRRIVSFGWAL